MSRSLSANAFTQITNEINSDPLLTLFRLTTESETLYFVNNTVDVTSNGQVYTAFPVMLTLAADDGETQPTAKIEITNVTLELVASIRSQTTPILCEIELVLASAPDNIEVAVYDLVLRKIKYDYSKISAELMVDDFLNRRFPADSYTPNNTPGIFS